MYYTAGDGEDVPPVLLTSRVSCDCDDGADVSTDDMHVGSRRREH
jgi:hypothetical protein